MSYCVYAIQSKKDGRIYVGLSQDVENRVAQHNVGQVFSTKGYRPWSLIYKECCIENRVTARAREKYLKSGCGKEFIKNHIPR